MSAVPTADWMMLHRARLCYLPEWAAPGEQWRAAVSKRVREHLRGSGVEWEILSPADWEDYRLRAGNILFKICVSCSQFYADPLGLVGGAHVHDRQTLFSSLPDWADVDDEFAMAAQEVRRLAQLLSDDFRRGFDLALSQGMAQVMARQGTVQVPFTRVQPDQWTYYSKGADGSTFVGPEGEKLYCVRVAPGGEEAKTNRLLPIISTTKDELACIKLLVAWLAASPEPLAGGKRALYAQARQAGVKVSWKGFESRCWPEAVRQANRPEWSKPGRRRNRLTDNRHPS